VVTLIVAAIVIVGMWVGMHALRRKNERTAREQRRLEAEAHAVEGDAEASEPVSPRTG